MVDLHSERSPSSQDGAYSVVLIVRPVLLLQPGDALLLYIMHVAAAAFAIFLQIDSLWNIKVRPRFGDSMAYFVAARKCSMLFGCAREVSIQLLFGLSNTDQFGPITPNKTDVDRGSGS